MNRNEVVAVEKTINGIEAQLIELADFQLALVGGGSGEVVLV